MARARRSKPSSALNAPPPPYEKSSVFDDPPRGNVFLLCCMDQRLLDQTAYFMTALNLQNRYDQLALAGGAMGVNRLPKDPPAPGAEWWTVFTTHLSAAIDVLNRPISDVFLIDHLDCGAYKYLHPVDSLAQDYREANLHRMTELHADELRMLADRVRAFCDKQRQAAVDRRAEVLRTCANDTECFSAAEIRHDKLVKSWTGIRISRFLMDLRGGVLQLGVPQVETSTLRR